MAKAIYGGHLDRVSYLCHTSPHLTAQQNADGTIPLHTAVSNGQLKVLRMLINFHCKRWTDASTIGPKDAVASWPCPLSPQDNCGDTPLMIAASDGNEEAVEALLVR
jgi:ankyrin repeat protein